MKKFKHVTPRSVEEATAILEEHGCNARIIAGGTDLLGEMKDRILRDGDYPEVLVNIKRIAGLEYVRNGDGTLKIGALTKLEDLAGNELVRSAYPALAEAAHRTASPHIREMGTVAGNICQNNRCWYYWVADNRFDCLRKGGNACYALPLPLHLRSRPGGADRLLAGLPQQHRHGCIPGQDPRGRHGRRRSHPAEAEPPPGHDRPSVPAHLRDRLRPR
jgi:xanthine dehydrogenase YagS FAD-binding subunit